MNAIYETNETETKPAAVEKVKDKRNVSTKVSPVFVEAERMFDKMAEITKETAMKAFDFFRERGGEWGKELDDWFKAESEILRNVPIEIRESDENIFVTAAVPGFKAEEIEVSVKNDLLILSGHTEARESQNEDDLVISEWKSNRFFRQLYLPTPVLADQVEAKLKDGMLAMTLPKAAKHEAKKIAVAAG
jgi:HSP20 family protein